MPKRRPVDPKSVRLERGRGSKGRGDGPGGAYWHIHAGAKRAGYVYIAMSDKRPFGQHAEIQIQINKDQQGRGIGRLAYRLACEESGHDVVYAHMRKSNVASRRAAEAAGFEVVKAPPVPGTVRQLSMRWQRRSANAS